MTAAAAQDPVKVIGHVATVVNGAFMIVCGVASLATDLPIVLAVALVVFGAAAVGLARASWRGSRIGWAFGTALDGVLAAIGLFGSPKVAHLVGIPLPVALIPFVVAAASCITLALAYRDYDK